MEKITCVVGPSGSGKSSLVFHTLANESKRRFLNSLPSSVTFFDRVPQSADVESISPVLPVWILPQHNPIVGSRLNLSDQFELTMDIAKLYFDSYPEKCPIHGESYKNGLEYFTEQCAHVVQDDNDIIHVLIDKSVYQNNISGLPIRSYSTDNDEVTEFVEADQFWELFRIKAKSISTIEKRLLDFPFLQKTGAMLLVFNQTQKIYDHINIESERVCLQCKLEGEAPIREIGELLPFNGVGACPECKGYGSVLNYSKDKLVKFPNRSVKDGAVSILSYSKFSAYEKSFIAALKKNGISLVAPFHEIEKDALPILMNGEGAFPGVLEMLSWLEEKRYKRSVRIFLRSVQTDSTCTLCNGTRISEKAALYRGDANLPKYGELLETDIESLHKLISGLKLTGKEIFVERVLSKLGLAIEFGLGSFKITKKIKELESNEYQKSLLVRYLSYQGSGSLFILDEPSLGLNVKEQRILIEHLKKLSQGNTLVLVDHAEEVQKASDWIIEVGPGAGHLGGDIVYQGPYKKKTEDKLPKLKVVKASKALKVSNIEFEDHKIKQLEIPLGVVSTVASFRESFSKRLLIDVIANDLYSKQFDEKKNYDVKYQVGKYSKHDHFNNIIVYETNIERASGRSTVGTMLGISPFVRKHYASLPVSKSLGLKDGHFSSNSDLGKCPTCEGKGIIEIDMQFLEDVTFPCEDCQGKKLNKFYSNISDGKYTIVEAYNTPIVELFEHIKSTPKLKRIVEYLKLLNLGYLTLDRTLPSLSGGERLRVKFLNTLQKDLENSLLIFTDISYGLSINELVRIRELMVGLTSKGNTLVVIDNHPIFKDFNVINIEVSE
ncbi:hypothetical protein M900_0209 [Bacteriovorax sp. Seq25_V]|nr:hypothetical protein M900_0209 [Bacteriovorax sp. Seq25_V]